VAFVLGGCTGAPRAPELGVAPSPDELLSALATRPAGEVYTAALFLEFTGGFLEEDELKINGEIALAWPDRVRVIGAYGAFKKVFDLLVLDGRFQLFDNQEGVLFRGASDDPEAAASLGFAVRPSDMARLLRVDGSGPLEGATVRRVERVGEELHVAFAVEGDAAAWRAVFDAATLELTRLRREGAAGGLEATYDGHFTSGGRRVPRHVEVRRLDGDDRVRIEVRSIRFRDELDARAFEVKTPEGAEIVDL